MKQNTPEWKEFRRDKIGASDAPIIMGVSPFRTPYQLWIDKITGNETAMTPKMQRGHDLEESARQHFSQMTGFMVKPSVVVHPIHSWMMASLDGIDVHGHIVEIKCPGFEDHQSALDGVVPSKYLPQLQHQMEVCNADSIFYFSFDGSKGKVLEIGRDKSYIQKMIEKERAFLDCLELLVAPQMTEKDYEVKTSHEWMCAVNEWSAANDQLRILKDKEELARQRLIDLSQGQNSQGCGVKLTKFYRRGNVQYDRIAELKNVNLEIYRKEPIEQWRISKVS